MANKTWPEWLRIIQPSDLLHVSNEHKVKVIPEGLFKHLQHRAKELLAENPNAAEIERQHWQSIVDGHPPYGLILECRTKKKGTIYAANLCKPDNKA